MSDHVIRKGRRAHIGYSAKIDPLIPTIEARIRDRQASRQRRDFAEADRIRDELFAMGVVLTDGDGWTEWDVELFYERKLQAGA